jgi:hypothetical protein
MLAVFTEIFRNFRFPAFCQFLECADIQIPEMEITFKLWNIAGEEAPILANGIAAHGGNTGWDVKH